MTDREMRAKVVRIESLLGDLEARADNEAIGTVRALLELYGEGLARIMKAVKGAGTAEITAALARDEVVSHLLLLHGLHPVDVETRVRQALDEVRPYLASHGGNAELIGVKDGVARLRLVGSAGGRTASTATLRTAIEKAVRKRAPDLLRVEAEGPPPQLVQLGPKRGAPSAASAPAR